VLDRSILLSPNGQSAASSVPSKLSGQFVVIPEDWLERLDAIPGRHAHRLMLKLMRMSWRLRSATIKVTNRALASYKMDRHTKLETLRRLERAGLISVEWRQRKSPLVTILFPTGHPACRYLGTHGAADGRN
jgi:hypothetical protein